MEWETTMLEDTNGNMVGHVMPVGDRKEHVKDNCWCSPVIDVQEYKNKTITVVNHNSLDRRECFE